MGFSLVELLTVIAILATLSAIAVPGYSAYIDKARMTKVIAEIRMLEKEIFLFQVENDRFPDTLGEIGVDHIRDPWGKPYQYANHATIPKGERRKYKGTVPITDDFDLYSMGKDGKTGIPITSKYGRDDIVRADNGGYVGPAQDF